jgi:hypothetical protein
MKIKAPCPFQPSASNRVEGGFHCNQCQRIVYDMRDQDKINEADWREGKKCGIFRADQLQPIYFTRSRRIYFSLLVVLASWGLNRGPIQAQELPNSRHLTEKNRIAEKGQSVKKSEPEKKIHWWQFRKKRKKKRQHWIGCPSF